MKKLTKNILSKLSFVVLILPVSALAAHDFYVRISNVSGEEVEIRKVEMIPKGPGTFGDWCTFGESDYVTIDDGSNRRCATSAKTERWQRKVKVNFYCNGSNNVGVQTFPRNGGWFNRNYLSDNNNQYKVAIKRNDC